MAISDLLNRRVRARPDDEEVYSDESASESHAGAQGSDSEDGSDDGSEGSNNMPSDAESDDLDEEEGGEEDDSEDDDDNGEDVRASLNNISFGALAKAQASLGSKNKRGSKASKSTGESATDPSPLDDIRARIREAREQKRQDSANSRGSEKPSRSSKHAPMVQSSKYAVSRKRTVIEAPPAPKARDPRFDATVTGHGNRANPEAAEKAYAFLDEYRTTELKELKERLAKTKNPTEKEALKGTIRSTTDRLRAMENRKREKEVLADHKKREKQLIREGKKSNPYYMKNSDLKKQVLMNKYESMNSKDRAKTLERRRKKMASKERKEMPWERRGMGGESTPFNGGDRKRRRME